MCLAEHVWTGLLAQAKLFLGVAPELVSPAFGHLPKVGIAWARLGAAGTVSYKREGGGANCGTFMLCGVGCICIVGEGVGIVWDEISIPLLKLGVT